MTGADWSTVRFSKSYREMQLLQMTSRGIFKRAANIIEKIRYLITQFKVIELARAKLIEQGYWSLYNGIFVLFLSLLLKFTLK